MESLLKKAKMSMLSDDCLRTIFLWLPVLERVKLRIVCKRWRKVSDDCWRDIKILHILDNTSDTTVWDYTREVKVFTKDKSFALGFVKRCAPYLEVLHDKRPISSIVLPSFSIQRAMKSCKNIAELKIPVLSKSDDVHLKNLFATNRQVKCLDIFILEAHKCLKKLCIDRLEDFSVQLLFYDTEHLKSVIKAVKRVIRKAQLLKNLALTNLINDELFQAIGKKLNLQHLHIDDRHNDLSQVTADGLNNILKLKNLRNFHINIFSLVNDEFLIDLSKHCVNLEDISVMGSSRITDDGLFALTFLRHLKNLTIRNAPFITNKYLMNFPTIERFTIWRGRINDTGAVAILQSSPNLKHLDLGFGDITLESVRVAAKEVQKRENKIPLNFYYKGDLSEIACTLPPLLSIIQN